MVIMSSSKGLSTSKPDDKDPTGGKALDSCSEEEDEEPVSDDEDDSEKKDDTDKDKKNRKSSKQKIDSSKTKRKPKTEKPKPKASSAKKPVRVPDETPAVNIGQALLEQSVVQEAASDAAADAAADAAVAGTIPLSADDAVDGVSSTSATCATATDELLTLNEILRKSVKRTELVGHRSLPTRKNVLEALSILCKCGHPDSARWLKSFIYGVVLLDGIMPSQFIELCLEMFDSGQMIIILAYELFHLQSWNSKCGQRMKVIVANPVPLWHLRQTMARAGRLGTEHSGEISSWVSCLVLPNSDVSASGSVSEEQMPLMIGNGGDICPIERAIMAMLFRGNFSRKHHAFIVEFLRLFHFVYRNEVCVHAFKGGRDYFMDFMRFISGVLVSKFVSPFECVLQRQRLEEMMCSLAFTMFRHGHVDDVEKTKAAFSNAMLGLVGSDSASMSLCLVRAVGAARKFVGISHFDLPQLFKDLYERYPDSLTSFLKLIRNLLMNLQTMPMCKCDRTVDATVSAMLLVVTTTLDFVGDILSLLADTLRERDMERFRVGFVQEVSPLEQLTKLLSRKAGLPTLQDFGAFINANKDQLPDLASQFHNVCDFLSPNPSGHFHNMNLECQGLKLEIDAKMAQTEVLEKSIGKPDGMKPLEWAKLMKSDEFNAMCKNVEKQISQLESEIQKLVDKLDSIEKVLLNLPNNLAEVVGYFKTLI
jgi:hypothetical protein